MFKQTLLYRHPGRMISILTAVMIAVCSLSGCAVSGSGGNDSGATSAADAVETAEEDNGGILAGLEKDGDMIYYNSGEKYSAIVSKLRLQCAKSGVKGVYLFASDDDIIFAAGMNDLETDGITPINVYTTYEIGSITKTFTAAAVFQLIEDGRLGLDDTLEKFFPDYETGANITISQLLHMRSGMYDDINEPKGFWGEDYSEELLADFTHDKLSDEEYLEHLYKAALKYEPGSRTEYCNTNYHLLAMIIEQLTGQSYAGYLRENIFDPCGMEHTSSMTAGNLTSVPYIVSDTDPEYSRLSDETGYDISVNSARGDGDIHSCAADLLAFDRALTGGELINGDSFAEMKNYTGGYGCGLYTEREYNNAFGHSGATFNYLSENWIVDTNAYGRLYCISLFSTRDDVCQVISHSVFSAVLHDLDKNGDR